MKKISWILACLTALLFLTAIQANTPPPASYIKVDKYSYCIGDPIVVYIFVPGTGEVTVWDHMTNGYVKVIFHQEQSCGQDFWYTFTGVIEGPPGTEWLEYEAYSSCCYGDCEGMWITDSVSFVVEDCGPCEEWLYVVCNESGYDLYVDGTFILTEDGDGKAGIKLEEGTHTVQLKKDGCDTITKTIDIICEHSTTLTVTMNCDPCKGVSCGNVCRGVDLWSQECVNGQCVDDQLIEANSASCGYDPCANVVCNDVCKGVDLWSQECVNGQCVDDQLIEANSASCGYDPCADHCNNGIQDCEEYGVDCGGGCPIVDTDSDGVEDCVDLCLNSRCNRVDATGCETDADQDGVMDCGDDCPSEKGDPDNRGCPSGMNMLLLLGGIGGAVAVGGGLALFGLRGGKPPTPRMMQKAGSGPQPGPGSQPISRPIPQDIAARQEAAEKIAQEVAREAAQKKAGAEVAGAGQQIGAKAAGEAGKHVGTKVAEEAGKHVGTKVAEEAGKHVGTKVAEEAGKHVGTKVAEEAGKHVGTKVAEEAGKRAGTKAAGTAAGAGLAGVVRKKQDVFCPNCGEKLPPDSKFCSKCGQNL